MNNRNGTQQHHLAGNSWGEREKERERERHTHTRRDEDRNRESERNGAAILCLRMADPRSVFFAEAALHSTGGTGTRSASVALLRCLSAPLSSAHRCLCCSVALVLSHISSLIYQVQ